MKHYQDVIIRPILTEQSSYGIAEKRYTFQVDIHSNKIEIKQAVEALFGVKVAKVNTLRTQGKIKRMGRNSGRTPEVKKAIVTLTDASKAIEFFEGMY